MKGRALQALIVAGIVFSLLVVGCTQPATPAPTAVAPAPTAAARAPTAAAKPQVYKIGAFNHLTGDLAVYGMPQKQGMELAIDEINKAGGIGGVQVQGIYEDDRGSAADAQTAVLKLVGTDKVPVVIGSTSSTVSLSVCPKINELKVVQVSISTSPKMRTCGQYTFSTMSSDAYQGPEFAKVAKKLGITEAAIMYSNNDYGIGVKDGFVKSFQDAGGKILIAQPFQLGGKDFRTEILKVKATNPKVVFLADHMTEGSLVVKQAKELGLKTQWIMCVGEVADEFVGLATPEAAEGAMGLAVSDKSTPEYKAFYDAFVKKFGTEPTLWSDFGYDNMMLVAKAIEKEGYTAEGIRKGLMEVGQNYKGASGIKTFDKDGIIMGAYGLMIVKNGKWIPYSQ